MFIVKFVKFLQVIVAIIFLTSSITKILDISGFETVLRYYNIPLANYLAVLVTIIELMISLSLLFNILVYPFSLISLFLCTVFVFMKIANYGKILEYGCGCFGSSKPHFVGLDEILKSFLLLLLCLYIFINKHKTGKPKKHIVKSIQKIYNYLRIKQPN